MVAVQSAQQLAAEQRSLDALDFKQSTNPLENGGCHLLYLACYILVRSFSGYLAC